MCVCVSACMCAYMHVYVYLCNVYKGAHRSQKKVSDTLEAELQGFESHLMWMLETELGVLCRST